jgi:hypothetical protein
MGPPSARAEIGQSVRKRTASTQVYPWGNPSETVPALQITKLGKILYLRILGPENHQYEEHLEQSAI